MYGCILPPRSAATPMGITPLMNALLALLSIVASANLAVAQGVAGAEKLESFTAAQAIEALRAKAGVDISVQSGWTVIQDRSN